jgi:hypothetical protein
MKQAKLIPHLWQTLFSSISREGLDRRVETLGIPLPRLEKSSPKRAALEVGKRKDPLENPEICKLKRGLDRT